MKRLEKKRRNSKRLFGAGVLVLMTLVAVGAAGSFAKEGRSGSYSLVIQKVFADGIGDAVTAAAQNQVYTFRITGEEKISGSDDSVPVEKIVRITGKGKAEVEFGNAFKVSVIEQTDDGGFEIDGAEWDVTRTECESFIHVSNSSASVKISKDGGRIKVTRPEGVPTVTFRLIGANGSAVGTDVTVAAGQTEVLGENLAAGEYTITKLRAADGFSVLVGERTLDVEAEKTGLVYINGDESKLQITAPAAGEGEPQRTHHYLVVGTGEEREIDVRSGETGTVDHLPSGKYAISVSETYNGVEEYYFTRHVLSQEKKTQKCFNTISTTTSVKRAYITVGGDYIDNLTYGPLYDGNGKVLSNAIYKFSFGALNPADPTKITGWSMTSVVKGDSTGNKVSLTGKDVVRKPLNGRLYVGTKEVSDANAQSIAVSWTEYKEVDKRLRASKAEAWYQVPASKENWLLIEKPADANDPRSDEVTYYYTIADANRKPITYYTATLTDASGTSKPASMDGNRLVLHAGEKVRLEGLHPEENYLIMEEVETAPVMPFQVKLVDTERKVTSTGGTVTITTLGERKVEISRPGDPADDNYREYRYNIYRIEEDGTRELVNGDTPIVLRSGESTTVSEALGNMLPEGTYTIEAIDDGIVGFDVAFTDSSSLTSDYISYGQVVFTNRFSEIKASYHVVHEYYLQGEDGSYTLEGISPVYTKNCDHSHPEGTGHVADDVHKMESYGGHVYTYLPNGNAYGKVVSWPKGGTEKSPDLEEGDAIAPGLERPGEEALYYRKTSNGTGSEEDPGTRDYCYVPVAGKTFALAEQETEGTHEGTAEIIILRYYRKDVPVEHGRYHVIHAYYRRTSTGDQWEGNRQLLTEDVGLLTDENRYTPYYAKDQTLQDRFTPEGSDREYPYVYAGAAYGRLFESPGSSTGEFHAAPGVDYRVDDTMNSVKATTEGDQVIILRYYRSGGYNVVHEYYYSEKASQTGDIPDEEPDGEDEGQGGDQGAAGRARDGGEGGFSGTLTDSEAYTYQYEGSSDVTKQSAKLESRHNDGEVGRQLNFRPAGDEQHTYVFKDAVYGYMGADGTYSSTLGKTDVSATDLEDEIIILRYVRGAEAEKPTTPSRPSRPTETPKPTEMPAPTETPLPTETPAPTESPEAGEVLDPEETPKPGETTPPELPDPNDPESPETVTIYEDDVPKTYIRIWDPETEEWVYLPEEEIPLHMIEPPATGDNSHPVLWGVLAGLSLWGLLLLRPRRRRRPS